MIIINDDVDSNTNTHSNNTNNDDKDYDNDDHDSDNNDNCTVDWALAQKVRGYRREGTPSPLFQIVHLSVGSTSLFSAAPLDLG